MKAFALGPTVLLRIDPGEEVVTVLRDFCARERIGGGHFHGLGSLSRAVLGFFDRAARRYAPIEVDGDHELASLTGTISTGEDGSPRVHAHAVLSGRDGAAVGGHLVEGTVAVTCEVVLTRFYDEIGRVKDPETGAEILDLTP